MLDRKHTRRTSNQSAVIHVQSSGMPIMCTVGDISEGGAGITVANSRAVPDQFELEIKGEPTKRQCKVAWRKAPYHLGVSFV